jgi:hypothetical protein
MAAALPDPGWPRGNCPILLLATTVRRSFHHQRLLPGLRPSSTQRKDVLFNPDSPRLLRTLRRGDRCFSGDRFGMSRRIRHKEHVLGAAAAILDVILHWPNPSEPSGFCPIYWRPRRDSNPCYRRESLGPNRSTNERLRSRMHRKKA